MIPSGAIVTASRMSGVELIFTLTLYGEDYTYPCVIGSKDKNVRNQGYHRLAELMRAVGVTTCRDSSELRGRALRKDFSPGMWPSMPSKEVQQIALWLRRRRATPSCKSHQALANKWADAIMRGDYQQDEFT